MKIRSLVPAVITAGLALPLAAGAQDNPKFSKNEILIGVLTQAPYGAATHADCLNAVEDVVDLVTGLGHDCAPATLALPGVPGVRVTYTA